MKKHNNKFLLLLMLMLGLPLILFTKVTKVAAAEINVNGLQAGQAVITNANGQVMPNGSSLNRWSDYTITWHWSVPNGTVIQAGDTAHFYLPDNVTVDRNVTFNITNSKGQVVGTANVPMGSHVGTITFSNVLSHDNYGDSGTLYMNVQGAATNQPSTLDWMLEKEGYVNTSSDDNGHPQDITWTIFVNPQAKQCNNININDQIGPNQALIPGSISIKTGTMAPDGTFTANGTLTGANIASGTNNINIHIASCHQVLEITYQTKITNYSTNNENTYQNVAHYSINGSTGQQATAYVKWGGGGTAQGYNCSVQLLKEDAATKQPLAGAVFTLVNAQGQVIKRNLVTNAQGLININELMPGKYAFVEVKAPTGYVLNTTPHAFTIQKDGTATVKVVVTDQKQTTQSTSKTNNVPPVNKHHGRNIPNQPVTSHSLMNHQPVTNKQPVTITHHHTVNHLKRHTSKENKKESQKKLPQTGDQKDGLLIISGLNLIILLIIVAKDMKITKS